MKPVLSHLLATVLGGLLVFAILYQSPENQEPSSKTPPQVRSNSKLSERAKSKRNLLAKAASLSGESNPDEVNADDADMDAFLTGAGHLPITRARMEKYLEERNHAADAYFSAGLLLDDYEMIRRAHKLDPDNPQYLYSLATNSKAPPEEQLQLARKLMELQPDNSMAAYILAHRQMSQGDPEAARRTLTKSLEMQSYNNFVKHDILSMEDALRATGDSSTGASLYSSLSVARSGSFKLVELALTLREADPATEAEAEENRQFIAHMGSQMHASSRESGYMVGELIGLSLQITSTNGLEDEDPSFYEGMTAGDVRREAKARRDQFMEIQSDFSAFDDAPRHVLDGFAQRMKVLGEYEANVWLRSQLDSTP